MPQRAARLPLLTVLKREATKALAALRQEITQRERELTTLKAETARWRGVIRGPARGGWPDCHPSTGATCPAVPARLECGLKGTTNPIYHQRGRAKGGQTNWSCLRLYIALDEKQESAESKRRLSETLR